MSIVNIELIKKFRKEFPYDAMVIHDLSDKQARQIGSYDFLVSKIMRRDLGIVAVLSWCRNTFRDKQALYDKLLAMHPDIHIVEFIAVKTLAELPSLLMQSDVLVKRRKQQKRELDEKDFFPSELDELKRSGASIRQTQSDMSYTIFYKAHQLRIFPPRDKENGHTIAFINGYRVVLPPIRDELEEAYKIAVVVAPELWKCLIQGELTNRVAKPDEIALNIASFI